MKKMKRFAAVILSLLLVLSSVPAASLTVFAEAVGDLLTVEETGSKTPQAMNVGVPYTLNNSNIILGDSGEITRAEWLHNLVVMFQMSVEEESLPDNYFADVDEYHDYYEDILLASEFGVIDIEAGEELFPDEPATRDFVATTLNFCLGYQPSGEAEYTFTDFEECTNPDDVQIVVNKGWFALNESMFKPETNVTSDEVSKIAADVSVILGESVVDSEYESTYEFAEGVIVIPDGTEVYFDGQGLMHIVNCPETVLGGDQIAVYISGIANVYDVLSYEAVGNEIILGVEIADSSDTIKEIDAQGVVGAEAMEIIPAEGVEVSIEEDDSVGTFATKKIRNIEASKSINMGGITGTVTVKINNPYVDYSLKSSRVYVTLNGETEVSYSVSASLSSLGCQNYLTLFTCNVAGVGSFDVVVEADFSGTATGTVKGYLVAGIECKRGDNIRMIKNYTQKEYYTNVEAETYVKLKATLGVTKLPVVSAYIYAETGVKANFSKTVYHDDTKPHICTHFAAYLLAAYGADASVDILGWKDSESFRYDVYTIKNSPVKIIQHYEDGTLVAACTRGNKYPHSRFFTRGYSRWSGSGWASAGGYGLDEWGNPMNLYEYNLDDNNKATITAYNGNSLSVYIPKEIDGYTVVGVGNYAFRYKNVRYVNIPDTVTAIGYGAFEECSYLKSISIPSTVASIGGAAFRECISLSSIDIPTSLETIDGSTFEGCSSLRKVTIPDNIISIGVSAFENCYKLKDVKLSENLTYLDGMAFGKTAIESIEIPKALDSCGGGGWYSYNMDNVNHRIATGPFGLCENLKTVTFEDGTTQIAECLFRGAVGLESIVIPDTVTAIEYDAFRYALRLKDVKIGSAVTTIGSYAFENCDSLEEIVIPNSVTKIEAYAFENCYKLKDVRLSKNLTYLGMMAFGKTVIESIEIPKALDSCGGDGWYSYVMDGTNYSIVVGPFGLCEKLKNVTFERGTTQIAECLFRGAVGLESIVIPDTVTEIEYDAFRYALRLKDVKIGSAVTTIGNYAFENCISIVDITIPNSVTSIGNSAFENCVSLEKIVIPNSVTKIEGCAFENCTKLKDVKLSKNLTFLGGMAFGSTAVESIEIPKALDSCGGGGWYSYNMDNVNYSIATGPFGLCENLKTVTFEEGTTQIASCLFSGAVGLESIIIPDTVTAIENDAFRYALRLKDVKIGSAVTTVGVAAFENCISITKISIPDSVTYIGDRCFENCTALEGIKLSNAINEIRNSTFIGCTSLKAVEFPDRVEHIGPYAFEDCTALESITFGENSDLREINHNAFYGCSALKEAVLPEKTAYIANYAFQNCTALEKVYIPQSTKTVGDSAFMGCESLSDLTIKDYSIKEIGYRTFKDCPSLAKVNLPKGLTTIDNEAFMNATGLKEIYIPESVTSISKTAFSYPEKMGIYGKTDSYAETFAEENGFSFNNNNVPSNGISLVDGVDYIVLEEGESYRAVFEYSPEDSNDVITLTTNSYNVSIDGHDITARSNGDAVITATSSSGVTFEFTVHIKRVSNITVSRLPNKTMYVLGEALDLTGFELKVNYNDNTDKLVTDYTVSGFDSLTEGVCTVTVSWVSVKGNKYTTAFDVDIIDTRPKLTKIEITALPTKLEYNRRDALDLTGLIVSATYNNGTVKNIDNYTVSGFNTLKNGVQTITVEHGGFTDTFEISVGLILVGMEVSTMPKKTVYYEGDEFENKGMTLKLTYSNGFVTYIDKDFTVDGFDSDSLGTKAITVSYKGYVDEFDVIVVQTKANVVMSSATGVSGSEVRVKLSLENNPGIASMMLKIKYNADVLTLVGVEDAGNLGTQTHSDQYTNPYVLSWVNDTLTENITFNGDIATLIFRIAENAAKGDYEIQLSYNYSSYDIYNVDAEKIRFNLINGTVTVSEDIIGDVNSDGTVDNLDRLILTRYLANWKDYPIDVINVNSSDVNRDGAVDNLDRLILTRHLANWGGYEGLPVRVE